MSFFILKIASWVAPAGQREEWLAEWIGELSFVREHCAKGSTMFCLGAFRDAWWLRHNDPEPRPVEFWTRRPPVLLSWRSLRLPRGCSLFKFRRFGHSWLRLLIAVRGLW